MTRPVLLYVEDEKGDVFFMRYAFDQIGASVSLQIAATGSEAIDYLSGTGVYADRTAHPLPTIILLDINLPGISGFDVLKWLREQPQYTQLPVIMFSSSIRPEDLQKARDLGATRYIEKPASGLDFTGVAEELQRMSGFTPSPSPTGTKSHSSQK